MTHALSLHMYMYMDRPDTCDAAVNIQWTKPRHLLPWQRSPTLDKQIPVMDTNALWVVIVVADTSQRKTRPASIDPLAMVVSKSQSLLPALWPHPSWGDLPALQPAARTCHMKTADPRLEPTSAHTRACAHFKSRRHREHPASNQDAQHHR